MKKTLVAIAALAFVGAASAQSSVTLYGRIDASIGNVKTTVGGATLPAVAGAGPVVVSGTTGALNPTTRARPYGDPGLSIRSGGHTGSRWGLKGTEDLGGGLKANFTLENSFSIDDGTDTSGFSRQAFVGLAGGFGAVNIGRQYDIVDSMYGLYDAMGSSGYSANAALSTCTTAASPNPHAGAVGDCVIRQNNSVIYTTPNLGGLSAAVMWAPGEDKTAVSSAGRAVAVMANYANGPLGIGAGYQSNKAAGASATTHYLFGVSYDLGVAKLYAQYDAGKVKSAAAGAAYEDKGFSLGAVVPVGAARLIAAYAKEDTDNRAGAEILSTKAFGLMAQYDLSKRTYMYAAYRNLRSDPTGGAQFKTTQYGLGLVHNF